MKADLKRWARIAGACLLVAAAPLGTERLSAAKASGFVAGYRAANAQQSILELVPKGETVENWSRMITDQRFFGLVRNADPARFAGIIRDGFNRACPAGRTSPVQTMVEEGRAVAQMRADCPLNTQTGKPETFFVKLIAGKQDLHSRQVAFRKVPGQAETEWAQAILKQTRLCIGGAGKKPC